MKKALLTIAATVLLSVSGSADTVAVAGGAELAPRGLATSLPADLVEQLLEQVRIDPSDGSPTSLSSDVAGSRLLAAPGAGASAPDARLTTDGDSPSPLAVSARTAPREPRRATVVIEAIPGRVLLIDSAAPDGPPQGLR